MKHRVCTALLLGLFASFAAAQDAPAHVGLPIDWSFQHVVAHTKVDADFHRLANREPRIVYNWLQRAHANAAQSQATSNRATLKGSLPTTSAKRMHGDWHFPLGAGGVATNMTPAKYTFDVGATPDCTNDFVIYGVNVAGGSGQPNLVGFNNLYSGLASTFTISATGASESGTTVTLTTTAAHGFHAATAIAAGGASESGTTVTITTSATHGLSVGQRVGISGVAVAGYNGSWVVATVPTATTFTYTNTASGLASSGGGTVGQVVYVGDVSDARYNGEYTIVSVPSTTSLTYTGSVSGLPGSGNGSVGLVTSAGSLCVHGTPTVQWAYNVSTASGSILTSPTLSIDGTKVAFIESQSGTGSAVFHVLTLGTGTEGSFSNATNSYTAATPGAGGSNASMLSLTYSSSGNTRSSPYIDYGLDRAYFGDDNGTVYATNCVFYCGASAPTIAWSYQFAAGVALAPPVVDSGMLFVGGSDGNLYSCAVANCSGNHGSLTIGAGGVNGGINDGVIIDSTFQTMLVTTGSQTGTTKPFAAQLTETNPPATLGSGVTANAAFWPTASGALNDEYYNNSVGGTTAPTGAAYFCMSGSGQGQAFSYVAAFSATFTTATIAASATGATESGNTVTITTTAAHGLSVGDVVVIAGVGVAGYNGTFTVTGVVSTTKFTYTNPTSGLAASGGGTSKRALGTKNPPVMSSSATSHNLPGNPGTGCSPIITFTSGGTERFFVTQGNVPGNNAGCTGAGGTSNADGCVFSYSITTSTGALSNAPTATFSIHGSTSGMIVDNSSTSTQAASLYLGSGASSGLSTSAPNCTYGTSNTAGFCAVKLTQSGLQ